MTQNRTSGLAAVHGSLCRLDPAMQQYLEQMTAAAVAREKAKLLAQLAATVGGPGSGSPGGPVAPTLALEERSELDALRQRVRWHPINFQTPAQTLDCIWRC